MDELTILSFHFSVFVCRSWTGWSWVLYLFFLRASGSSSLVFITIPKCNVLQMLGMMERDQDLKCGGHFLIMDTGHGKTVTSLLYAYRRQTWSRLVEKKFWQTNHSGRHMIWNWNFTLESNAEMKSIHIRDRTSIIFRGHWWYKKMAKNPILWPIFNICRRGHGDDQEETLQMTKSSTGVSILYVPFLLEMLLYWKKWHQHPSSRIVIVVTWHRSSLLFTCQCFLCVSRFKRFHCVRVGVEIDEYMKLFTATRIFIPFLWFVASWGRCQLGYE